jgi:DMSO reductase anchor subunit
MPEQRRQTLSLTEAVTLLLEECRMVLPGIQALFGFQLIAVFNARFAEALSPAEQILHLAAIALVAVAVGLVMAPAAYHRQMGPKQVTDDFIAVASRLLSWSMFPLMLGTCLDFYLIARLIVQSRILSLLLSLVLLGLFSTLWFFLPHRHVLRDSARGA